MGAGDVSGLEGALAIPLRIEGARVAAVTVRGTRRTDVASGLCGMPVEQALRVVPSLFSICGDAHAVAALDACEAALGASAGEVHARARRMLCALEALDNHAFSVCAVWPTLAGHAPATAALLRARAATIAIRRWAFPGKGWAAIGGAAIAIQTPATPLMTELRDAIAAIASEAAITGDDRAIRSWAARSDAPAAPLFRSVYAEGAADFGHVAAPLLPDMPAAWYEARLASPAFSARPTLDGVPAESGAIARAAAHPAVEALIARSGRTLVARFVARLCDMRALVASVEEAAGALHPSHPVNDARRTSGTGTGVADTARGRLAHRIEIDEGRVIAWRTVAPTEWTFHPEGVIREALLGAPAEDLRRRAEWLVGALDPCVACSVHIEEAADA